MKILYIKNENIHGSEIHRSFSANGHFEELEESLSALIVSE